MYHSLKNSGFQSTCVLFLLLYLHKKGYFKELSSKIPLLLLSMFISLIWVVGASFHVDNSLKLVYEGPTQIIGSSIKFIGFSYVIFLMFAIFNKLVTSTDSSLKNFNHSKLKNIFYSHPMLITSLSLFVLWIVPIICVYPANVDYDSYDCIAQYYSLFHRNLMHPPIYEYFLGIFTDIGLLFGDINIGLFVFLIFQALVYALILGYSLYFMVKLKSPTWLLILYFITISITPYYAKALTMILKDNLFSIFVLLFIIELVWFLSIPKDFIKSHHLVNLFISTFFIVSLRYNGKYVLYPTIILLFFYLFFQRRRFSKKLKFFLPAVLIEGVLLAVTLEHTIIKLDKPRPGSIAEVLSFPFQQTARLFRVHPDKISQEQKEVIDLVLDINKIGEAYNPRISDPVKYYYRGQDHHVYKYLKLWFSMFFQFPLTYINATVNQSYILIYPFEINDMRNKGYLEDRPHWHIEGLNGLGLGPEDPNKDLRAKVKSYFDIIYHFPVISELSHTYLFVIVFLFTVIQSIVNRKYVYLLCSCPILLSIVVIILAPCIYYHPRYAYPVLYSVPVLLSYYIFLVKSSQHSTYSSFDRKSSSSNGGTL